MKKVLTALVAVTVLSLGVAFADEAKKDTTKVDASTSTNPITGSKTEKTEMKSEMKTPSGKKRTTRKHKKVTKKTGEVKSDVTKTDSKTDVAAPATR